MPGTGELGAGASGLPPTGLDHGRPGGHRRGARPDRERDRLDAGRRRPGLPGLPHRHRVAVLAAHRRRGRRAAGLRRAGCGQQRRSVVAAERRDVRAAVGPEQDAATLGRPGPRVLPASVDPTLAGHPGRRLRPGTRTRTRRHGDLLLRWRHPLGIVLSRRSPGTGAARRLSRRQGRRGGQWGRLHRRRAARPALALQGQPGRRLVAAESGGLRPDQRGDALAAAPYPLSVRLTQAGHARRAGHRVRHDGQPLLVRPGPRCAGLVARLVAQRLRRTGRLEQPRGGRGKVPGCLGLARLLLGVPGRRGRLVRARALHDATRHAAGHDPRGSADARGRHALGRRRPVGPGRRATETDGDDSQLRRDQRFGVGRPDPCGRPGPGRGLRAVAGLLRHPGLRQSLGSRYHLGILRCGRRVDPRGGPVRPGQDRPARERPETAGEWRD